MTVHPARVPAGGLRRRRLAGWQVGLLAVAAVAASAGLLRLAGSRNVTVLVVLAAAAFVALLSGASAIVEGGRRARDRLATGLVVVAFGLAVLPLIAVLSYTLLNGLRRMDLVFLTHSMRNVGEQEPGGGAYHAIVGTLEQVGLATVVAVPLGILVALYLAEYGRGWFARTVSLLVDVLLGLPSIVAGLFIYALWVLTLGRGFSGFAGSLALMILMLPTVIRTSEEMLRLVPHPLREASLALGVSRRRTVLSVVLPTALSGIVTGVLLAVARVMGETAPLLFTVFGNTSINFNPFSGPQSALPLFVFSEAQLPNNTAIDRAWAGALTLIVLVMLFNLAGRIFARLKSPVTAR